jgi:hypothetical protein
VRRGPLGALVILAVTLGLAVSVPRAGGTLEVIVNSGTAILPIAWDDLAIPVSWKINEQGVIDNCDDGNPTCVGGVSPVTLQRAIDALQVGFDAWEDIPSSRIAFRFDGTSSERFTGVDGINLITWADDFVPPPPDLPICGSGTVAVTPNFTLDEPLTVTASSRDVNGDGSDDLDPAIYPDGTILPAGTMVDADMAWCPASNDYTDELIDTTTLTFDIVAVGTHEIGHFLGGAHSALLTPIATLLPFVDTTIAFNEQIRTLAQDDIASASRIYPEPSFLTDFGTITGQLLFPGTTTGADGVSVTAFNVRTGEMAVQVFSVTRFTATGETPGSFRIDGLLPGTYRVGVEYFNSSNQPGWWYRDRYNLTTLNSNVGAGARPGFYSSPETSTDDLGDPVVVDVQGGVTVDIGDVVINTDPPPTPAGGNTIALNLSDRDAAQVIFPEGFSFPFFGQSWTSVFVNDDGNLTFGAASPLEHTQNFLGPDVSSGGPVPPRIGRSMTDLDPGADNQPPHNGRELDAFARFVSDTAGDRVEVIYLGVPVFGTDKSCTAIARLFGSGRIEIQHRFFSAWWGIVGLSPGGSGDAPFSEIDISRQLPFSTSAGEAVFEHFVFGQPPFAGGAGALADAFDLNGALLVFTPNAANGYDVTSPDLEASPPGLVANLRFESGNQLAWDLLPAADTYSVYSGLVGGLVDGDGDGAAESYGTCHETGIVAPSTLVSSNPAVGTSFLFLVSGFNPAGEGPFQPASSGADRPNADPCPSP